MGQYRLQHNSTCHTSFILLGSMYWHIQFTPLGDKPFMELWGKLYRGCVGLGLFGSSNVKFMQSEGMLVRSSPN